MSRKRIGIIILLVAMGLSIFGGVASSAKTRTLKFSHYQPANELLGLTSDYFAKRVDELSKGTLKIQVFPANQLGAPQEVAEQVRLGVIDMATCTSGQIQLWVPQYAAIQLPFLWDSYEHANKVLDGTGGKMLADLAEAKGFHVMADWLHGFRAISNDVRPINTVADMKGLKLRVPPEVPMEASMRALGAIPTQIAWPEVYMALAQGVVDGQENPIRHIFANRLHEHQKYLAIPGPGYMYITSPVVVGAKMWKSLTAKERTILQKAAIDARNWMREQCNQVDADALKQMTAAGVVVTRPNPAEFRAKMDPAWKEISKFAGTDFVEKWVKMVDKAR